MARRSEQRPKREPVRENDQLEDLDLSEEISDGVKGGATGADPPQASSNILKTRHDTVKNSIGNVR